MHMGVLSRVLDIDLHEGDLNQMESCGNPLGVAPDAPRGGDELVAGII